MKPRRIVKITHTHPLDALVDSVMRCTVCGAKMGECDCWTRCGCGWSYRKGTSCNNPACDPSAQP